MSEPHGHDHTGGPDDGAFDWFRILDMLVWVAVAAIVIMSVEYLLGWMARERIARQAQRFLVKNQAE